MAFPLPSSLSPSKVSSFKDCALAFRLANIDKVPETPSEPAVKGTLVHRALQLLMRREPAERTVQAAMADLDVAIDELRADPEFIGLGLDPEAEGRFVDQAEQLVRRYFELEDPTTIRPIGLELLMEAELGSLTLRGIIDRLELGPDGELVVTDYKTGRAPDPRFEQGRLAGVHFYALLCEQMLGVRPARVQLLHLADPVTIVAEPTDQKIRGMVQRTEAVWQAVERACEQESFQARPGRLCDWCSFQQWCPAFGGDIAQAPRTVDVGWPAAEPSEEPARLTGGITAA